MQKCFRVFLIAAACCCLSAQPDPRIPKDPPPKLPALMMADFEAAKAGDVFAMLRVNHCHGDFDTHVFPYDLIRERLEELVNQGNSKAMLELADNLPWDQEHPSKNKPMKERRKQLIEHSARLNEPTAMNRFASDLWRYDRNKEEAIKWWVKGKRILEERANHGDRGAIVAMARYSPIPPIEDNPVYRSLFSGNEWMDWLRKAAEFDRESALQYGLRTNNAKWVEKAAIEGDWIAMVEMGCYWAFGFPSGSREKIAALTDRKDPSRHVPQPTSSRATNAAKAWEWWDKAAELVGWELVDGRLPESDPEDFPKRPSQKE